MERMQQAYEALIDKMESEFSKTTEDSNKTMNKYVESEEILIEFIVKHHGKQAMMQLAKEIDEKHGTPNNYTEMVDCTYED